MCSGAHSPLLNLKVDRKKLLPKSQELPKQLPPKSPAGEDAAPAEKRPMKKKKKWQKKQPNSLSRLKKKSIEEKERDKEKQERKKLRKLQAASDA